MLVVKDIFMLPNIMRLFGDENFVQVMRFGIVGVAATMVHMSAAFTLFYIAFIPAVLANALAFLVAWCVSYTGQVGWTFKGRGGGHHKSAPKFFVVSLLGFMLNLIIVWVMADIMKVPFYVAVLSVVVSVPILTFVLSKYWVFKGE